MGKITEPAKDLRVTASYDTVVCGGGIAGISAALAAARSGSKTLLIEKSFLLGGLATAGIVTIYLPICDGYGHQVSFGISEELLKFSVRHGTDAPETMPESWIKCGKPAADERYRVQFNPHVFALECDKLLEESGADLLFGAAVCGVKTENGRITHLIIEAKSGREAIAVKNVIDATGDADIVHFSGEDEARFGQGNVLAGWYYLMENGRYNLRMVGVCDVPDDEKDGKHPELLVNRRFSGLDTFELNEQVILSHKASLNHFFKDGKLTADRTMATVPTYPQLRMTRRVDGVSVMKVEDMHTEFDDSVGLFSDWRKRGPVYELRFSALHGKKIKNLICAGRNISSNDSMWDVTRVIPVCAVSGEAAGVAAAMTEDFTSADVTAIGKILKQNGIVLHEKDLS